MWIDEERELAREASRIEARVAIQQAGLVVDRLEAEWLTRTRLEPLRRRRDELALRVRKARAELTAWRERTTRRARALASGAEGVQGWFSSTVRACFRGALIVISMRCAVSDGSASAFMLALLPVIVLWVIFIVERD